MDVQLKGILEGRNPTEERPYEIARGQTQEPLTASPLKMLSQCNAGNQVKNCLHSMEMKTLNI